MEKAAEFDNYLKSQAKRPYNRVHDATGVGGGGNEFPVSLSTSDPEDAKWQFRNQAIQNAKANNGNPNDPLSQMDIIAPDSYFDYMKRKSEQELLGDYEAWVYSQVDLTKPETMQFWYNAIPWLQEKRLRVIEEQAEIQKRVARLAVEGVKSEDDMKFIFALKQGLVPLSGTPLYDLNSAGANQKGVFVANDFQAGLMNPYATFFIKTPLDASLMTTDNQGRTALKQFSYKDPVFSNVNNQGIVSGLNLPTKFATPFTRPPAQPAQ